MRFLLAFLFVMVLATVVGLTTVGAVLLFSSFFVESVATIWRNVLAFIAGSALVALGVCGALFLARRMGL